MIQHAKQKQPADPVKQLVERFLCPITQDIMQDPVVAADGFTYERAGIMAWIETRGARAISPVTGERLAHHELVSNIILRNMIQEYLVLQPTLKQKKLTEQDIQTAIRIRDEEMQAMLEKRERQVATAHAERDSVVQQLGPMERENAQLRTEIQELHDQVVRSKSLLANAVLDGQNKVDLPIDATLKQHLLNISQLEAETAEQRKHRAANIIKRTMGQYRLRKLMHSSRLQEAKKVLLHKKEAVKETRNKENMRMQQQLEVLAKRQDWRDIAQLSAQAQTKETDFARQEQELDRQLSDLSQAKAGKRNEVERRANRLARLNEQVVVQKQHITHHIEEQRQQAENLTNYLEQRLPSRSEPKFFAKKPKAKPIQPPVDPGQVEQLLRHIVRGEQDEAEDMLQKTPALACATGTITDHAPRTFAGITALQYAVWALDWHMWTMILKYLPQSAAREQCLVFQDNSVSWIRQHGKHFDLNPLIQALQTYVSEYNKWDDSKRRDYWCKTIGGLQRQLPAHVINEYCRPDRSFDPIPSFKEPTLPRRGYVDTSGKEYGLDWLLTEIYDTGLSGVSWAVHRCANYKPEVYCYVPAKLQEGILVSSSLHTNWARHLPVDVNALGRCQETRTQQVEELFDNLNLTIKAGPVASTK